MHTIADDATLSHMALMHERSIEVRGARAQAKRRLKSGRVSLRDALSDPVWAERSVLEVVGYAVIGHLSRDFTGRRAPSSEAGQTALRVVAECGITHGTPVAALSASRVEQLLDTADAHGVRYVRLAKAGESAD